MFAVVEIAGFQEKVTKGATLKVPLLPQEKGKVVFSQVYLIAGDTVKVGAPFISGASVEAEILRHGKGDKVRVQKALKRKRYRRLKGHRQDFTEISITKINE